MMIYKIIWSKVLCRVFSWRTFGKRRKCAERLCSNVPSFAHWFEKPYSGKQWLVVNFYIQLVQPNNSMPINRQLELFAGRNFKRSLLMSMPQIVRHPTFLSLFCFMGIGNPRFCPPIACPLLFWGIIAEPLYDFRLILSEVSFPIIYRRFSTTAVPKTHYSSVKRL